VSERFDKLLVLDLDETLIYADEKLDRTPEFTVGPYQVVRRPGVDRFLEFVLDRFREVAIWTASTRSYAEPVLDQIVDRRRLAFVWGRERCVQKVDWELRETTHLKDIAKLRKAGYDDRQILFVDDSPEKLARSYGNLIEIRPFQGEPDDGELALLERYLLELGPVENVRAVEKRGWRARFSP
jgi:TFIIF-interacting CTD phosphatase-like protein